ncbi:MAG: hypothetical protein A2X86_13775 [Bdellovibrionales bacterium GWA2_49_15]|nr:MAG: hypothetical protein A2X86_13775 [Bdellovibrionales bacterium GWA2_49_15]HAZ13596.1 hypothetical protein [Bdellovibrionales bacterium]
MVEEFIEPLEENFYEQALPLRGKHIVTQKEGAHLGDVMDVYLDPIAKRLSAILFTKNALGMGEKFLINAENIEALGEDVLIASDKSCAIRLSEATEIPGVALETFKGVKVTTLLGKNLGIIDDIQLRPSNLRIGEIIFEDGKRLVVDPSEITMGEDAVLVPEDYTSKVVIQVAESESLMGRLRSKEREWRNTITDRTREVGKWMSRTIH